MMLSVTSQPTPTEMRVDGREMNPKVDGREMNLKVEAMENREKARVKNGIKIQTAQKIKDW